MAILPVQPTNTPNQGREIYNTNDSELDTRLQAAEVSITETDSILTPNGIQLPIFTVATLPVMTLADQNKLIYVSDARTNASQAGGFFRWNHTELAWVDAGNVLASTEFEYRQSNSQSLTATAVTNTNRFVKFLSIVFTGTSRTLTTVSLMAGPTTAAVATNKMYGQILLRAYVDNMAVSPNLVELELLSFSELLSSNFIAVLTEDTPTQKTIELYHVNTPSAGTNRLNYEVAQAFRQPSNAVITAHANSSGVVVVAVTSLPAGTQYPATYSVLRGSQVFLGESTAEPVAPSAGHMVLYTRSLAGRLLPKVKSPMGPDTTLQPFMGLNNIRWLKPSNGTTLNLNAIPNTTVGTISHPALASTNLKTQAARALVTSAAGANSASELYAAQTLLWLGNAANLGGFFCVFRFGVSTTTANQRLFVGLHSATGAIATTQVIDALTNIIGVGWDSADTTLRIMHNDSSGAATEVDLGANFPTNSTTAFYELILYAAPNATSVSYRAVRLDTGSEASGTITTNLPANTTFLTHHQYMNNGGTAAAVGLEVMGVYIETDY